MRRVTLHPRSRGRASADVEHNVSGRLVRRIRAEIEPLENHARPDSA